MASNSYEVNIRREDDHSPYPQPGKRFGYAFWLQPFWRANDTGPTASADDGIPMSEDFLQQSPAAQAPEPARRGRGRPRVNKSRNETAVEKRRAQVREAQRTYQKRKDTAAASERQRGEKILEVMSDLSIDIEALLQTAARSGALSQHGELADRIRQLWFSYDTAISKPCMKPELRLLQVKNDRRRAENQSLETQMNKFPAIEAPGGRQRKLQAHDTVAMNTSHLNLERLEETTLIQPFAQIQAKYACPPMGQKSIFEVVKERQNALAAEQDGMVPL